MDQSPPPGSSHTAKVTMEAHDDMYVGAVLEHQMPVAMMNPYCALAIHRLHTIMNCARVNQERLRQFLDYLGRSNDEATLYCAVNAAGEEQAAPELTVIKEELQRALTAIGVQAVQAPADAGKGGDGEEEYLRMLFAQLVDEIVIRIFELRSAEDGMAPDLVAREVIVYTLTENANETDLKEDQQFENNLKTSNTTIKELVTMTSRELKIPKPPGGPDDDKVPSLAGWPLDLTSIKLSNDITLDDYMLGMHGCVLSAEMTEEELDKLLEVAKGALQKAEKMEAELVEFREVLKWAESEFRELLAMYGEKLTMIKSAEPTDPATEFDQLATPIFEAAIKLTNELHANTKFVKNCEAERKSLDEYMVIIEQEGNVRVTDAAKRAQLMEQEVQILRTAVDEKREDIERLSSVEKQLQQVIREEQVSHSQTPEQKVKIPEDMKTAHVQRRIEEIREVKETIMVEKGKLQEDLSKLKTEVDQVDREGAEKVAAFQAKLEQRKADLSDLIKRLTVLQNRNEVLCKQLEALDQERVLKETTLRQMQVRHDLESRLRDKRRSELESRKALLLQKRSYMTQEVESIKEQLTALKSERDKEAEVERKLDVRISNVQDELSRSRSENRSARDSCPFTATLDTDVDGKSARAIEAIVKDCTTQDDAAIRLGLEISRYSRYNEFYAVELDRNQAAVKKLQAKVEQTAKRLADLLREIDQHREESAKRKQ